MHCMMKLWQGSKAEKAQLGPQMRSGFCAGSRWYALGVILKRSDDWVQAPAQTESQNGFSGNTYDRALVDARALRAELEGGLKQYRTRNDSLIKQMNVLHARSQRRNPTVQAVEELKQAQIQVGNL